MQNNSAINKSFFYLFMEEAYRVSPELISSFIEKYNPDPDEVHNGKSALNIFLYNLLLNKENAHKYESIALMLFDKLKNNLKELDNIFSLALFNNMPELLVKIKEIEPDIYIKNVSLFNNNVVFHNKTYRVINHCICNNQKEVISLLLDNKIDFSKEDDSGKTPLSYINTFDTFSTIICNNNIKDKDFLFNHVDKEFMYPLMHIKKNMNDEEYKKILKLHSQIYHSPEILFLSALGDNSLASVRPYLNKNHNILTVEDNNNMSPLLYATLLRMKNRHDNKFNNNSAIKLILETKKPHHSSLLNGLSDNFILAATINRQFHLNTTETKIIETIMPDFRQQYSLEFSPDIARAIHFFKSEGNNSPVWDTVKHNFEIYSEDIFHNLQNLFELNLPFREDILYSSLFSLSQLLDIFGKGNDKYNNEAHVLEGFSEQHYFIKSYALIFDNIANSLMNGSSFTPFYRMDKYHFSYEDVLGTDILKKITPYVRGKKPEEFNNISLDALYILSHEGYRESFLLTKDNESSLVQNIMEMNEKNLAIPANYPIERLYKIQNLITDYPDFLKRYPEIDTLISQSILKHDLRDNLPSPGKINRL